MGRTLSKKFPIIGYIAVWPSNRIVKVKIGKCCSLEMCEHPYVSGYPYVVVSLEKGVRIDEHPLGGHSGNTIYIADPSLITLYKSRKEGEKAELEKLHDQHLQEKIDLSKQAKRVKAANKRIYEYKAFKQIQTI